LSQKFEKFNNNQPQF